MLSRIYSMRVFLFLEMKKKKNNTEFKFQKLKFSIRQETTIKALKRDEFYRKIEVGHSFQIRNNLSPFSLLSRSRPLESHHTPREQKRGLNSLFPVSTASRGNCIRFRPTVISWQPSSCFPSSLPLVIGHHLQPVSLFPSGLLASQGKTMG